MSQRDDLPGPGPTHGPAGPKSDDRLRGGPTDLAPVPRLATAGPHRGPALVVLAAGIGSRYGGLKQVEAVGPGEATLLEYSVFDALGAGFARVVFVIREEMLAGFRERLGDRIARRLPVEYVFQRLDDVPDGFRVPAGRTKPWGTAHALLAAGRVVREPFAVINADDLYGARALRVMGEFLSRGRPGSAPNSPPAAGGMATYALVAYRLGETLSEHGAVSRGVCRCTADGWLESISEIAGIRPGPAGGLYRDEDGLERELHAETRVSMNLWGFTPDVFDHLRAGLEAFLEREGHSTTAEYYLPTAVRELMQAGRARVRVLATDERWCGITHRQDLEAARRYIAAQIERGIYPQVLWA